MNPDQPTAASPTAAAQHPPVLAVVVPCYKEEKALPLSMPRLLEVLDTLTDTGEIDSASYVLCVDDGSTDRTWEVISALHRADPRVRGIALAHNRGHQYALLAGLMTAMPAIHKLQNSMGLQTIYDHADYRLMSRRALEILSEYKEQNLFLRGIVPQIGLTTAVVRYDRAERVAGDSKYPLKKMLAFSVDGITSFSAKPLRWIFFTGMGLLAADLVVAAYVLIAFFMGRTVDGWSSLMLSVWFLGSLILIAIGLVGEYVARVSLLYTAY